MLPLVLRFVESARASGMRISTSEVMDCARCLELVDPLDEAQVKTVLTANFVKSIRDQARFEKLYALFFSGFSTDADTNAELLAENIVKAVTAMAQDAPGDPDFTAAMEMMAGDAAPFLQAVRALESDNDRPPMAMGGNLGQVARRLSVMLALQNIERRMRAFLEDNRRTLPFAVRRDLQRHFEARLALANRLLTEGDAPRNESLIKPSTHEQRLASVGEKPFVSLTEREVEEMRAVIDQWVRKLKDVISLRYRTKNRGLLDVKKTLRKASRYQGVPIEIVRRKRPPRKGKVVTLCDVSGSVWSAARFMLNMLYSVQECFTKVRSFIFVAGLADVTRIFEENEINKAVEKVLKETPLSYNAATDYGATLRQFKKEYMDIVNKKTTVIVVGDGRSNYCNPEAEILAEIRERSRRIIWLNPESEVFWNSGDSEMRTYERYCHEVRPCQNLNQLLEFIQDLVL
ncbi:MAG: VWA domain-containing protein [Thermodesulfobacteriota bacterium]